MRKAPGQMQIPIRIIIDVLRNGKDDPPVFFERKSKTREYRIKIAEISQNVGGGYKVVSFLCPDRKAHSSWQ